jgi:hypothetical protein
MFVPTLLAAFAASASLVVTQAVCSIVLPHLSALSNILQIQIVDVGGANGAPVYRPNTITAPNGTIVVFRFSGTCALFFLPYWRVSQTYFIAVPGTIP